MCRKLSLKSITTRYHYLTTDMKQSRSSEVNISSGWIDIPRILWDLGVYFLVKNSLPLDPTLRQTNPVLAFPAYKFKIYLAYLANPCISLLSPMLPHQIPACTSVLPRKCQAYCTSHPQRSDGPNTCEKRKPVLGSHIFLSTLFCDTLNHVLPLT